VTGKGIVVRFRGVGPAKKKKLIGWNWQVEGSKCIHDTSNNGGDLSGMPSKRLDPKIQTQSV